MIRFGIIGTSWISEAFLTALCQVEGACVTAVYSRTLEKAREFAARHGAEHSFCELADLAASDALDAVYIASPNSLHAAQAIFLLERGKHVLCEKPIAANSRELQAMIDAAQASGTLLMEAMKSSFLPNWQAVRDNIGRIGQVRRFVSVKCQYSSRYDLFKAGKPTNTFEPAFANGSLMDIGVYALYPILSLFGEPQTIQADGMLLSSGVDGQGSVTLRYPEMDAMALHSKVADSKLPSEIQGEEGTIIIDKISTPGKVTLLLRDGRSEDLSRTQEKHLMAYEIEEFCALLRAGRTESSVNSHALALQVMRVLDEARRQVGVVFPAD
ncbi:Gfo/Idh/MocA family oxidoreductase [Azotosporobacter soli]|uniref:Gfo/Idh/MocA family protein n=1 Tax=Azotosporobacter soli TaxID=3055040 RepID=UPI0031FEFEC4